MKNIFLISIIGFQGLLFFVSGLSFADVTGSKHDMYSTGKGTNPNVCSYCHIPHNAAGDKIWSDWGNEAQLSSGPSTTIGNMCYTCHDGTVTSIGQDTAFNTALQQHKITTGQDCDMCHSVHDNTNGKFMNVGEYQNSYCANCHNAANNAGGFGDMTVSGNHPSYWTSPPPENTEADCFACHFIDDWDRTNSCYICHEKGHGAVNYSTAQVSNPILRIDNTDSAFCATCHPVNVQSTSSTGMSSGVTKHPANLDSEGMWGDIDCESCHDPHQPDKPDNPFILQSQNVDSGYCDTCHDTTGQTQGPDIGYGHPVDVPLSMVPADAAATPVGDTIDDDDVNGVDYPANSSNMICETCHSIHRKGTASPLLRLNYTGGQSSELCINCHP